MTRHVQLPRQNCWLLTADILIELSGLPQDSYTISHNAEWVPHMYTVAGQ